MSRSYTVLAVALVGVLGLVTIARVTQGDGDARSAASADAGTFVESSAAPASTAPPAATAAPAEASEPGGPVVAAVPFHPTDEGELASAVRGSLGLDPLVIIDTDCELSIRLEVGDENDQVACLESQLIAAGALVESAPDAVFDPKTAEAVKDFQEANSLVVDGVVGPQTARVLGIWTGPDVLPPDPETCPASGRSAVIDRFNQRAWLCEAGEITDLMPITTALTQPDPGSYDVYAKDLAASSTISGGYSEMTHFVAFTRGKYQGARIAFHSIPIGTNGEYVQPLDSVGTADLHGASAGCIRVLPEDAELIWSWLDIGDTVKVVT
jgi:lipoprotein-anchoring transpeptidase ErfK/SrfK